MFSLHSVTPQNKLLGKKNEAKKNKKKGNKKRKIYREYLNYIPIVSCNEEPIRERIEHVTFDYDGN